MFDFGTTNRWQKHEEEIVQAADMVNILLEYKEEVKPISSRIRTLVAYCYINYSVSNFVNIINVFYYCVIFMWSSSFFRHTQANFFVFDVLCVLEGGLSVCHVCVLLSKRKYPEFILSLENDG